MNFIIANFVLSILPPTRFFALKRTILNFLNIRVGLGTRVCGQTRFYGGGSVSFGQECWIGIGCKFYTGVGADVVIEDNCDIAPEVSFMCGTHDFGDEDRRAGPGRSDTIKVQSGTWIGIGCTLLGGTIVGRSSMIAARAVVLSGEYPPNSLLAGSPAMLKRQL